MSQADTPPHNTPKSRKTLDTEARQNSPSAPKLPWLEWKPGERVVVRRRESDGLYDSVGRLLEVSVDHVTIETKRGQVTIPATKMVTGKRVPDPPIIQ